MANRWEQPTDERSTVSESEAIVRAGSRQFAEDVRKLTNTVVGPSRRGFMQVKLSPEERSEQYRMWREQGGTQPWIDQLIHAGNSPKARAQLLKEWREQEARYREQSGG